jgi:hypothetical protein
MEKMNDLPDQITELELVNDLRLGNRQAYEKLYEIYAPVLTGIANKIANGRESTDIILYKTFIHIRKNKFSYDPSKERLLGWMIKALRLVVEETNQSKDLSASLGFIIQQNGTGDKSECENHQKWVLESMYYNGYSIADVGHKINLGEEKVRFMLKQAIHKLNKQAI